MEIRLSELARELGATLDGSDRSIEGVATLDSAGPRSLSFFANRRYKSAYLATKACAVVVAPADVELGRPGHASLLVIENPYLAFAKAATKFYQPVAHAHGIDPLAAVDPSAEIEPSASVLPFAYVGRGVRIGARVVIHTHCAILDGSVIGEDSLLYPGVVVREGCTLGARSIVQPGAVVGGDGFGFAFDPDGPDGVRHFKIPQMGKVRIEDDVEIGANTCIDRGSLGDTIVGQGTKLDNLVQIAHNVEIGPLSLLAGCTAVAGSTKLGMGVVCGGQVGIIGHLNIGDGARFSARTGVASDVEPGATISGWPGIDHKLWLRMSTVLNELPDMAKELRALRKKVSELEARLSSES